MPEKFMNFFMPPIFFIKSEPGRTDKIKVFKINYPPLNYHTFKIEMQNRHAKLLDGAKNFHSSLRMGGRFNEILFKIYILSSYYSSMKTTLKFYSLWLCLICIIIFVIQVFFPVFKEMFLLTDQANNGEFWRFFTAIFLQIFFAAGIIANLIAVNYYESSLGASGAIYGVIGALTMIRPFIPVFAFSLPMPLLLAAILWASGDVLRSLGAFGPTNIGAIAHLTGILVGIIMGIIVQKKVLREKNFAVKLDEKLVKQWEDDFMKDI